MRVSKYVLPTLKENPSDAVVLSHRLMLRAGLMRKESAGMYAYLPLGLKVLRKVTNIVKEEMDRAGAHECLMPELTNADYWKESGRWQTMGPEMFRIEDRNGLEYALGPTHEEAFTNLVRSVVSSYRDLPLNLYQINTKFRDEIRPRFGVIRSKEFIMKDAYSFDIDQNGLDESYNAMAKAYRRIFERCGLETIPVQADSGNMGGSTSEEFMVASEIGEEVLLICEKCEYRANSEKAEYKRPEVNSKSPADELKEVHTPDVKTIEDLVKFFNCDDDKFLKSIIYVADGKPLMVVVPGSREVNEHKLKNFVNAVELGLASDEIVQQVTGAPFGFAGPVGIKDTRIIFDISIKDLVNTYTGANKKDYHYSGVNPGRDFSIKEEADITSARAGDICPKCGASMYEKKGIEVGHIFKLGYKYTKAMNLTVLDEKGEAVTPIMGCYGIGVNRTMAAIVEQCSDERGIIWPKEVTPFHVHLVGISKTDEETQAVDAVYENLKNAGIDVLYDDRKASPGFKFADADLIGIPLRITAGKGFFANGELELKERSKKDIINIPADRVVEEIKNYYK
ncbi:MAG TPA: proline--tRNA ligase [Spirochaetota bacterium]|nr:proline--tRNA ligase [Spirochaetota bacterium]HPF07163.1 proline--tRNA ligase [Spirochaetota bacterium]HPJ41683.1 proline--tRNA ligase [Spirochaetota bacterium]HPR37449.1 proline--tRNA ligase [Spirochaetota bacterium]